LLAAIGKFGRFLQFFNQSAFQDFLAIRAEYLPIVEPLFKEYFMETRMIDREIVESARSKSANDFYKKGQDALAS